MELSVLNALASLGVGAVFGGVMFYVYRADQKKNSEQLREDRRYTEDRMTIILENYNKTTEGNSKALTELIVLLHALNGRLK